MTEQSSPSVQVSGERAMQQPRERLGDIVVNLGFCDRSAVEEAVAVFATGSTMTVRVEVAVRPLLSVAT